jgi:hypothetical protein
MTSSLRFSVCCMALMFWVDCAIAETAKIVEQEFGRLSADGASAFDDIHLARLAIFDGKTDEAAKLIADAQESLARAKSDEAKFIKAEAAFHRPRHMASPIATDSKALVWIPIESEITVGNSFVSDPERAAAVVTARKSLARGDGVASLHAIKLSRLDINYTVAAAPLESSIAAGDRAGSFVRAHDYYSASQVLREAEAAIRYDQIEDVANVAEPGKAGPK